MHAFFFLISTCEFYLNFECISLPGIHITIFFFKRFLSCGPTIDHDFTFKLRWLFLKYSIHDNHEFYFRSLFWHFCASYNLWNYGSPFSHCKISTPLFPTVKAPFPTVKPPSPRKNPTSASSIFSINQYNILYMHSFINREISCNNLFNCW